MKMKSDLSVELVRELLDYVPQTGALTWRVRSIKWFSSEHRMNAFNGRFADKPAFTSKTAAGYHQGDIFGRNYLAHRVIHLWMTGHWPEAEIDHIDMNRANNAWANLRVATRSQNSANKPKRSGTSSRFRGVTWERSRCCWQAQIRSNNRNRIIGRFDTEEAAARAYDAAALSAHGQFARLNFPQAVEHCLKIETPWRDRALFGGAGA